MSKHCSDSTALLLSAALFSILSKTNAQKLPHNECQNVFSYQREGDYWVGLVKSQKRGQCGTFVLKFTMSDGKQGKITQYSKGTSRRLFNGQFVPVVRFKGFTAELPKIILVKDDDGKVLCSANEHSGSLEECGILGPSGFAVGGTIIARGHFPWMAALYIDNSPDINSVNLAYKCISAHILRVWIGRHDMNKDPEPGAIILEIERIEIHPENDGSLVPSVDLALLILRTDVQFTSYVRPICMWESNTYQGPESGENAQICGWGYDASGMITRFPNMVTVNTMTQEACVRQMTWAKDFITSRTICASNDMHHGPCLGDSGGSLMVQRNNKMYIRGVVSLGQRMGSSCDLKYPVIYCDVAQHRDWIERTMVK